MKNLKQILIMIWLIGGISISAAAQKDGDKKPPPKETPPVIVAKPKPTPKEDKPKKPQTRIFKSFILNGNQAE